ATARLIESGPAMAPTKIREMFPDNDWTILKPQPVDCELWACDRFADTLPIQSAIYRATPNERHILIGGDHSVNFAHFAAVADNNPNDDLCLVYIDAHMDAHTPQSSKAQASGAPHGTNVRALTGDGDKRWLNIQTKCPALKPENLFYIGVRSYEPAELEFVQRNNIYMKSPDEVEHNLSNIISEIKQRIGSRKFVLSFDFDVIDPTYFRDVLVPEANGITPETAMKLVSAFSNATAFEFVEYAPSNDSQSADIVRRIIDIALYS
ncbi:MAG: arginase family protein, partial [Alphaproteobacteria bacterium]|nr:arginase family protein [Alphaproteobacteria bacterium]